MKLIGFAVSFALFSLPLACRTVSEQAKVAAVADGHYLVADPSAFPSELAPRKTYDLTVEWTTFINCTTCQISADPAKIKTMVETATATDFFFWVIRPDGKLVVGRGPDPSMSHGVLASIDPANDKAVAAKMGNILTGGEGYFEPATGTLTLKNKSGHYRPPFSRLATEDQKVLPELDQLFKLASSAVKTIVPVDTTKPGANQVSHQRPVVDSPDAQRSGDESNDAKGQNAGKGTGVKR